MLNQVNSKKLAYLLWLIVSIFYAYQYILRVLPNIILEDIMQRFNINAAFFGQFSGVYYLGYVAMHLPLGMMLDHYGPKKIITSCILLCSISLLPLIFASNPSYLIISRVVLGIGSSAAILGVFKVTRISFSSQHFTKMLSISVTIGLMGAIYGGGPLSYLYDILGYKLVVKLLALVGLILAIITYFSIPAIKSQQEGAAESIIAVFLNHKVILFSIFAGFMVGPLEGFADVWGAEYLKKLYNMNKETASYMSSLIFVGMCFGAPFLSYVAEKTGYYTGTIIGSGIIMFTVFSALIMKLLNPSSIIIGFILVGICCSYQILAIYKVSTFVSEKAIGITSAIANMIIMSFGYGFHTIIGFIISKYQAVNIEAAFTYGISVVPLALIIGIIGIVYCLVTHVRIKAESWQSQE